MTMKPRHLCPSHVATHNSVTCIQSACQEDRCMHLKLAQSDRGPLINAVLQRQTITSHCLPGTCELRTSTNLWENSSKTKLAC